MSRETVHTSKIRQFVAVVQFDSATGGYVVTRHCNGSETFPDYDSAINHADEWVKAQHLADLEKV